MISVLKIFPNLAKKKIFDIEIMQFEIIKEFPEGMTSGSMAR